MLPSSRTPEGEPAHCPRCGNYVVMEPSRPPGDATCRCCGGLLWYRGYPAHHYTRLYPTYAPWSEWRVKATVGICRFIEHIWWFGLAVAAVLIETFNGGHLISAAGCGIACLALGYIGLPLLERWASRLLSSQNSLWIGAMAGWAVVPGTRVGLLFGVLAPVLWGWPGNVWAGALLGLCVGPMLVAIQGLATVTLASIGYWLITGKKLWRIEGEARTAM